MQALGAGQTLPAETFTVTIIDGTTQVVTVTITVTNDAPVAVESAFTVSEDAPIVTGSVTASDIDANAVLSFAANGAPPAGLIFNADGSYSFDPSNPAYQSLAAGAQRVIAVPYTVTDDQGATSTKDLVITVVGINDAPVARPDNGTALEDTPFVVAANNGLLTNDNDVDFGASLRVTQFSIDGLPGSYAAGQTATIVGVGTLLINADGPYTFTPSPNYSGATPLVNHTISDGTLSTSSTLTLAIEPVNDAPRLSLDDNASHNTVSVQAISGLFNTRVNDAGAALAEGNADPHYGLITAPFGSTSGNNGALRGADPFRAERRERGVSSWCQHHHVRHRQPRHGESAGICRAHRLANRQHDGHGGCHCAQQSGSCGRLRRDLRRRHAGVHRRRRQPHSRCRQRHHAKRDGHVDECTSRRCAVGRGHATRHHRHSGRHRHPRDLVWQRLYCSL